MPDYIYWLWLGINIGAGLLNLYAAWDNRRTRRSLDREWREVGEATVRMNALADMLLAEQKSLAAQARQAAKAMLS